MGNPLNGRTVDEQAALRRVATLVVGGAPPEAVFVAVAEEVGRLLATDSAILVRYDVAELEVVGAWIRTGAPPPTPIGGRLPLGGHNVTSQVHQTGQPARFDYRDFSGVIGQVATHDWGLRSSLGVPVSVEGRLWGAMVVAFTRQALLPSDTEARLAGFTELVAAVIANAQARLELRAYAEEQAALRRVATLVAGGAPPEAVFAAVTEEVGRLLVAVQTNMARYDSDGAATLVGVYGKVGGAAAVSVGDRYELGGRNTTTLVFQTGRPARIEDYATSSGMLGEASLAAGYRSSVAAPINVEGRLWGVIGVASTHEPFPTDTEARLAGFTQLIGTAIANAETQAALIASRARIVAAADTTRRRIERDLHDGVQQRLVSLALRLRRSVLAAVPPEASELITQLDGVAAELDGALVELREIARGLHPGALAVGGLSPALKTLARRSVIPVRLNIDTRGRLPEPIELAAYYVVGEALTNATKHSHASVIDISVETGEEQLWVRVRDDGRGGADLVRGSGLIGLTDRVEALGGSFSLQSPAGAGTMIEVVLPLTARKAPVQHSAVPGQSDHTGPHHPAEGGEGEA